MPYAYIWEYEVDPRRVDAFLRLYGTEGEWVRLFRRAPGYRRTELLRDRARPTRFITVDYWDSAAAWKAFRGDFSAEFDAIDANGEALTTHENEIGRFDAPEA